MTDHTQDPGRDWNDIARAAEDFARRVARDTRQFAEKISEHAGEFAHDVSRDWRRRWHGHGRGPGCDRRTAPGDVRMIFDDVRGVLGDVLDGIDDLIGRMFQGQRPEESTPWTRVVSNREVTCGGCARTIGAGEECHCRRAPGGREFRCLACGPAPTGGSAQA